MHVPHRLGPSHGPLRVEVTAHHRVLSDERIAGLDDVPRPHVVQHEERRVGAIVDLEGEVRLALQHLDPRSVEVVDPGSPAVDHDAVEHELFVDRVELEGDL